MDFNFSDEQTQLADGLKRFIAKECSFADRQKLIHSKTGESDKIWQGFVDLGLQALPVPENLGGVGGTPIDMLIVMQEFGRGLVVGPYFATVWGAEIIKAAASAEQQSLLTQVAEGTARLAVGLEERQSRYELYNVQTTAVAKGDGYVLNGTKSVVVAGATASHVIVSARTSGAFDNKDGISLFLIPTTAKGLTRKEYRTVDGYRAADIILDNVAVTQGQLLGEAGTAWGCIEDARDYALMLLCAEAVGLMESMCTQTTEYAKTRKQFGQPIGKFQVLQHRMVDMFMQLEQARSMAYLAAVKISSQDAVERHRTLSAVKARVGQAAKFVAQQSIQTYGGMGVSDEVPISHYFKRLTTIEITLGDTDFHLARFLAFQ